MREREKWWWWRGEVGSAVHSVMELGGWNDGGMHGNLCV